MIHPRQREIPALGQIRQPQRVMPEIIDRLPDAHQALLLSFQLSGMTDESIRTRFGIGGGQFSRIRSKRAHFPTHMLGAIPTQLGNLALVQYLAALEGFDLVRRKTPEQANAWLLETA